MAQARCLSKKAERLKLFDEKDERLKELFDKLSIVNTEELIENEQTSLRDASPAPSSSSLTQLSVSQSMTCLLCDITFDDRSEQVQHHKSDWHRFNLKQKLRGAGLVTETEFTERIDDLSSLSGSNSSSDSESDSEDCKPLTRIESNSRVAHRSGKIYMRTADNQIISIYKSILLSRKEKIDDDHSLLHLIKSTAEQNQWMIIMFSGGHFGAAVIKRGEVLVHKTFHRYVVRAKAGGAQSVHDKQGKKAKSAGATIRRHNEAALAQEITELLESWQHYIKSCDRIFYRISTHNYYYIFNKNEKYHLSRSDTRVRPVSLVCRRPTYKEVMRVYNELSTVTVTDGSEMRELSPHKSMSRQKNASSSKPDIGTPPAQKRQPDPKLGGDISSDSDIGPIELISTEESLSTSNLQQFEMTRKLRRNKKTASTNNDKTNVPHSKTEEPVKPEHVVFPYMTELYTACVSGSVEEFTNILSEHKEEILSGSGKPDITSMLSIRVDTKGRTFLHVACIHGQVDMILYLLNNGSNPASRDDSGTVPYLSTQNKTIRTELRFYMNDNPDKFDYSDSQIPGGLSREQEAERRAKEAERKKKINKKRKEKLKEKKVETAIQRADEQEKSRFLNLSDREKRALAAEKRILQQRSNTNATSTPVLSRCYQCAVDITGKVPFEYSDYVFCSPACLKLHRKSITAH